MSKSPPNITGGVLLAFSALCISIALIYFSQALIQVAETVSNTFERIDKILAEVDELQEIQIPRITETVDEVVAEISKVRNTIPTLVDEVVAEISKVRNTIPTLVDELEAYRMSTIPGVQRRIDSIIHEIPQILVRVDSISEDIKNINRSVDTVLYESAQIRQLVPLVTNTINASVDSVHNYLETADKLIGRIDEVSKNAGENTGSGLVEGIVTSPLRIAFKLKSKVFDDRIEKSDLLYVENKVLGLLESNLEFKIEYWENPETGSTGLIETQRDYVENEIEHKKLKITFNPSRVSDNNEKVKITFRKNEDGWSVLD